MNSKIAYTALGFLIGWLMSRPLLWFAVGTAVGVCSTIIVTRLL